MPNTSEYKNYLFAKVPEGIVEIEINYSGRMLVFWGDGYFNETELPGPGSWQIIGKGDRIDWEGIVDEHVFISDDEGYYTETYFRDYEDVQQIVGSEYNLDEANKSGHSLLRSLGLEPGTTLVLKKNEV